MRNNLKSLKKYGTKKYPIRIISIILICYNIYENVENLFSTFFYESLAIYKLFNKINNMNC